MRNITKNRPRYCYLLLLAVIVNSSWATPLTTETIKPGTGNDIYVAEGVVEAVRSSTIGAELAGRVTALMVKAGDKVHSGQVMARIDERVAAQQALASQSQVAAAQAQLSAAQSDFDRRQKLYEQKFLSKAALERAESDYKSAAAQAKAQIAQANAAGVQTGLHTLTAPYTGVVAETGIELGDMVMPGKPLITVYDPSELRIDTYRASGAGGQHVNKTESAIRITHLPTGIVVACQDERSQGKNRMKAMKILRSKILEQIQEKQAKEVSQNRRSQVGTGDRSEKIRTYNFPQDRITDHRINFNVHNLPGVMEGNLDPLIHELQKREQEKLLADLAAGSPAQL